MKIIIIDDDILEGDETYMVSIESISESIANGTGNAASFTIQDNTGRLSCVLATFLKYLIFINY